MLIGTAWVKLFVGQPGNGKGYNVTRQIAETLASGGHVSTNVDLRRDGMVKLVQKIYGKTPDLDRQYNFLDSSDRIANFHLQTPAGTPDCPALVVIDEADIYWDSRNHAKAAREEAEMFTFLKLCRHQATMVLLVTQSPENLNARMRRLAEVWDFRDLARWNFLGWKPLKDWFVCIQRPQKGGKALKRVWVKKDQAVFRAYTSSQFSGHVKRGGSVERIALESTGGRFAGWRAWVSRWWKRIFLAGFLAYLLGLWFAPPPKYGSTITGVAESKSQPRPVRVIADTITGAAAPPPAAPAPPPVLYHTGPDGQEYAQPPAGVLVVRPFGPRLRVPQVTLASPPYPRPEVLRVGDWSTVLNTQIAAFGTDDGQPVMISSDGITYRIIVGKSHYATGGGVGGGPGSRPPSSGGEAFHSGGQGVPESGVIVE